VIPAQYYLGKYFWPEFESNAPIGLVGRISKDHRFSLVARIEFVQLLFTYAPPLQRLLDNEVIPVWVWPWLLLGGLVFSLAVGPEKLIIRSSRSLRRSVTAAEAGWHDNAQMLQTG
jgi:hypothetical protein